VKRLSIVVSVLIVAGLLLAGCGGAATPVPTVAPKPANTAVPTPIPTVAPPPANTAVPSPIQTVAPPAVLKIRIGTDATFPPFELVDETTKEITGFDVDLMKAVAAKAGIEVEFINVGFDPLLAGIAQCQYDGGIAAITITDERKQQMAFSDPYFDAGQVVVVKQNNTDIQGKANLSGKTVGSQIGTTGAMEVEKIEGAKLKTYDTFGLAFQDLINGQIDAVIADNSPAVSYVDKNAGKLKIVGEMFTSESYGIAVCNKQADLVQKLNQGIAAVKADGTLDKLIQKWIVATQ
jgi:polar amino acid transport system substrate-binding protein